MKTAKRLAALLLISLLLCCGGVSAYAHDVPDLTRQGSINISMHCGDTAVPGGSLTIYRVGDIWEDDGNYSFVPSASFTGCVSSFEDIQSKELAQKLADYAEDNEIPCRTQEINDQGQITFAVEQGLYLLVQNQAAEGYQAAAPFLVSVPMNEDGTYIYDVDASPKVELTKAPQPFVVGKFPTVAFIEISPDLFVFCQSLGVLTHYGMNHCHFQRGDFLGSCFSLADISWKIVVDIQFVKHFLVDTVYSTNTLDNSCRIVRNVVIEYGSCTMQVVSFRYGICRHQYVIVITLQGFLKSCIKICTYTFLVGVRSIR